MLDKEYNIRMTTIKYDMTNSLHNTMPYSKWAETSNVAVTNQKVNDYKILFDYGQYYIVDNARHKNIMNSLNHNLRKIEKMNNNNISFNYTSNHTGGSHGIPIPKINTAFKICKGIFTFIKLIIPMLFNRVFVLFSPIAKKLLTKW